MLDLKFSRNLLGPSRSDIGNGYEASFRDQPPDVFRVASPHLPHPEHTDSQLTHASFSPNLIV